ncbi:methylosome subunit pICln-like isoform X1 [Anguilla rostrata]|uniref:methylosome subunit pICln-like isoform X1 n=2 Tax=Anguilla rostrata TaxID=7938 RepID=UPI0030D4182C
MVLLKNVSPPSEGVRYEQSETTVVLDGKGLGPGTLYVAETRLSWFDESGKGFFVEYPTISLHAISRDMKAYPQEHLYVMVNTKLNEDSEMQEKVEQTPEKEDAGSSDDDDDEDDDDDSSGPVTEIRFVPSDKTALEPMFSAMCDCQALHPDPEDSDSDFEGDEYDVEEAEQGQEDLPTFCTYEEGLSHLTLEGQATLERLEGMLAESVANQSRMAGVSTEDSCAGRDDGIAAGSGTAAEVGQFEDADVDHW